MENVEFHGKRIALPWNEWCGIEISPEGIHHPVHGLLRPADIDLLFYKAAFYDRGNRLKY